MKDVKPRVINIFIPGQCVNLNKIDRNKQKAPTIIKNIEIVIINI